LSKEDLRFKDLLIDGLESEHMNYHLQKLIDLGLVLKSDRGYSLTDQGKDYTNLMDDAISEVEKQPKTSVIVVVGRKNKETEKDEFLMNRRLRQPYFGKVATITGKVRFGETLEEAVLRELFEESRLTAKTVKLVGIYHKLRVRETETVQDVLFYRHFVTDVSGEFIDRIPFQENFWAPREDILQRNDLYDNFTLDSIDDYLAMPLNFSEDKREAQDY
ncbi:hypothetical protein COZ14_00700, partial [Candidatus Dojkabacteria bacterium CG_4_10_14_3_um_filter_Dojkabacteria_WS6_41_9]